MQLSTISHMLTNKLTIGHITDLHARHAIHGSASVVARRSRDMFHLLPRAIERLKEQGVDLLVLTGDLVDVPTFILEPNDYYHMPVEPWLPLIEADYRQVKAILDAADLPYMVLPGNHDYEPVMWRVFDCSANVLEVNPTNAQPLDDSKRYRLVRFCDREWDEHVPRRFDRERKLWLEMLADKQSPPQIHLQHYVIIPRVESSYPHNYLEADDLSIRMNRSGRVLLSISGHFHRGSEIHNENGCRFVVGPAFCEFPHPVSIYTLTADQVDMERFSLSNESPKAGRPVVFLDRDGVINDISSYNTGPEEMTLIPGAAGAIRHLRKAGYTVVVITNQSAVGLGHVSARVVDMVHERMCQLLVEETGDPDAQPDAIFFSTGAGENAIHKTWADQSMNKPSSLLLHQAKSLLGLDRNNSWMVGDRVSDMQAGIAFGAVPILVRTGHGRRSEEELRKTEIDGVVVLNTLKEAATYINSARS